MSGHLWFEYLRIIRELRPSIPHRGERLSSYSAGNGKSSAETWPRAGMTRIGIAYQLSPLVPLTSVIGCGSWPTPTASDAYTGKLKDSQQKPGCKHSVTLAQAASIGSSEGRPEDCRIYPTPTSRDYRYGMKLETVDRRAQESSRGVNLSEFMQRTQRNNGELNPNWVEWLMGYPIGYTELEPLETPLSPKSPLGSGTE
jgi:hypothetical protein